MFNQLRPDIHRLSAHVRLTDIVNDVPVVHIAGPVDAEIAGITTDSRKVRDRWMFVATEGEHSDGHRFVQSAIENGASVVVVQRKQYEEYLKPLLSASFIQHNGTTMIVVNDSRESVAHLADRFYGSPARDMRLVGITGTNGKTTTSILIKSILESAGERVGLIGTIEYHIGRTVVPASFTTPPAEELHRVFSEMRTAGCTSVVMEVSSHALALKRVHGLQFDVTLFTNLTQDHLDFHQTMSAYRDAKALLFSKYTRRFGLINADDAAAPVMSKSLGRKRRTYGKHSRATFRIVSIDTTRSGLSVIVRHKGEEVRLHSSLVGTFNAYNITAAYAVGNLLGLDRERIVKGIRRVKAIPGRFERIRSNDGVTAIVDYSHTPDSLEKAITAARDLVREDGRIITVFGCGGDRDPKKRPLMGEVASRLSDVIVVTSDNPRSENPEAIIDAILEGMKGNKPVMRQSDRRKAIAYALRLASAGDVVLIAGKGHETYQIVGAKRTHFDDREVVRDSFTKKRGGVV